MEIVKNIYHFIAIGGVGMSGLAKYLAQRGAQVSGSDIQESKYTHLLENLGIKVYIGHDSRYIKDNMIIVASSAVKDSNPEIQRARELGLKIYHRSDILKMISDEFSKDNNSYFIGFSGTHGKTTTSGLCSYVLDKAGLNPSFVVGGIIPDLNTNAQYGSGNYFIAELDESDGTIQKYSTDISVINNMEEDHLDYYTNGFDDIAKTFDKFLSNNPKQKVLINIDNEGNRKFIKLYPDYNYVTYGTDNADYTAKNIIYKGLKTEFEIYKNNCKIDSLNLSILGSHNVYNALAVYAALNEANIDIGTLKDYFYKFSGMGRRFQKVCEYNGITIYDDYAHHPSEIKTTLESVKKAITDKRIVAIFQPHRYSRLKGLWNEFLNAFNCADKLFILDVYSAGEDKIDNINSKKFSKEINHKNADYISGNIEQCAEKISPLLNKDDLVITLGAGSVTKLGRLLEENSKKGAVID